MLNGLMSISTPTGCSWRLGRSAFHGLLSSLDALGWLHDELVSDSYVADACSGLAL